MATAKELQAHREQIAQSFIHLLEEKGLEWRRGWDGLDMTPRNGATGAAYNGINRFQLFMLGLERGYTDPRWVTMNQIMDRKGTYHKDQKWSLQKGSKAVYVEYWYPWDPVERKALTWQEYRKLTPEERNELSMRVRFTPVFHASMVDGIPPLEVERHEPQPLEDLVSKLSETMGVEILNDGGAQAFYRPSEDKIHLPALELFRSAYEYSATALHELTHATGHSSRLDRLKGSEFGSPEYAYEELVAEIGSCFMGAALEVEQTPAHIENHKAYVRGWIEAIREKPETLALAIQDAQKAASYMDHCAGLVSEREYETVKDSSLTVPAPIEQGEPSEEQAANKQFPREMVQSTLQMLVDHDLKNIGEVSQGVLDVLDAQGYALEDGAARPREERQRPWSPVTRSGKLHYTDEQYQVAKEASALEYARRQGYHLVKQGSRYTLKEHDSMVFLPDGRWHWNSKGLSGRALQFMTAYEGKTLPEAVLTLNGIDYTNPERPPARERPYQPAQEDLEAAGAKAEFVLPPRAGKMTNAFSYLCKTRGLDYDLVRQLVREGRIYETENPRPDGSVLHNAVFVGFDAQGEPRSASLRGCGQTSKFKLEQPGSNKSHPFEIPGRPGSDTLYVFESAIDAASHATLQKLAGMDWEGCVRIGQGGNAPVEAVLNTLEAHPEVRQICFCLDNDDAGQKIFARLKDNLVEHGIAAERISRQIVPVGKDWNEYLQVWRQAVAAHEALPTTEYADPGSGEPCGRIHFLAEDRSVSRTVEYTDRRHFENAAAYQMRRLRPCIVETPAQLTELQRAEERRAARQRGAQEERREEETRDRVRADGEPDLDKEVSREHRETRDDARSEPDRRVSMAEQLAAATKEAERRNQERQAAVPHDRERDRGSC